MCCFQQNTTAVTVQWTVASQAPVHSVQISLGSQPGLRDLRGAHPVPLDQLQALQGELLVSGLHLASGSHVFSNLHVQSSDGWTSVASSVGVTVDAAWSAPVLQPLSMALAECSTLDADDVWQGTVHNQRALASELHSLAASVLGEAPSAVEGQLAFVPAQGTQLSERSLAAAAFTQATGLTFTADAPRDAHSGIAGAA
ncbi:unnamed protein product, partial [Symbiodinium sp. KB8]